MLIYKSMKTRFHRISPYLCAACIMMMLTLHSCHTKKQAAATQTLDTNTTSQESFLLLTKDSLSGMMSLDVELDDVTIWIGQDAALSLGQGHGATLPLSRSQQVETAPQSRSPQHPSQQGIFLKAGKMKFTQQGKLDGSAEAHMAYSDTSETHLEYNQDVKEQSSSTGVYEPPTRGTVRAIVIAGLVILFVFLYRYYAHPKPQ